MFIFLLITRLQTILIKSIIQNKTHKEFEIQQQELYELLENWIDSYCLFFKYDNKVLKEKG